MTGAASLDARAAPGSVTVVVPVYNAAATLPRALQSVLAQTRAPDEIVLVDDGSSDSSWEVIDRFRRQQPDWVITAVRLRENRGAASARNAGWNVATCEFIAFLDADDAWHPRKIEIQQGWMNAHPEVVMCGHICVVLSEGDPPPPIGAVPVPVRRFGLRSFLVTNCVSTPTVMLRRAIPNRFKEGKRYSEDYLLWMELIAAHGPAAFIELPLAFLFKPRYGAAGLSAQHWAMRLGEINTFDQLRRQRMISPVEWVIVSAWGWIKFAVRMTGQAIGLPRR